MTKINDYLKNDLSSQSISRIALAKRILGITWSVFTHPITYGSELIRDLHDDYLALTGKVSYKYHVFFIAGLPKSGTTWLEQLIGEVPGYVQLNKSLLRNFRGSELLSHPHGVNHTMLSSAPTKRYSYLKLHTHFTPEYVHILTEFNIRPIVLIRDLRDVMISRYHHIMLEPTNWMYDSIKDLKFEEGFTKSLHGIIPYPINPTVNETALDYYRYWVKGWLEYIRSNPEKAILIRHEEMKNDLHQVLDKILRFYEIYFDSQTIDQIIEKQIERYKPRKSLSENLKQAGRQKTTFRRGQIGEWKECFNERHKDILKKEAGDVLILSGYENDLDW